MLNKKRPKWPVAGIETLWGAEGGTRTPMPVQAQRPERCVSTSFTTSAYYPRGWAYYIVTGASCQEDFGDFFLSFSHSFHIQQRWHDIMVLYSKNDHDQEMFMPLDQSQVRGAIDIGSNTIHIVVAHSSPDDLAILADEVDLVRIGESVTTTGGISDQKRDEALAVLQRYKTLAEQLGAESILVVATEAIRQASNSNTFLEQVRRETGLAVHLINGDVEATLTFFGATYETLKKADPDMPLAVMDLGGGSTELITALGSHITWLTSISIGSGALHDRYMPSDPPNTEELDAARSFLRSSFLDIQIQQKIPTLIATGGSANSLLFLAHRADFLDANSHHLTIGALQQCEALLLSTPAEEIAARYDQPVERTRILPAGCVVIQEMIAHFQLAELQVSSHGIREGMLLARERYGEQWLERVQAEVRNINLDRSETREATSVQVDEADSNVTTISQDAITSDDGAYNEPFADYGQKMLHERLNKLLDWRDEVVKDEDSEAVHRMRVASRRLRAILDAYESCCKPRRFHKAYREVKRMADLLGAARDTDVMLQKLQDRYQTVPCEEQAGIKWLIEQLQSYRQQKQHALERYFARLDEGTLRKCIASCLPKGVESNG